MTRNTLATLGISALMAIGTAPYALGDSAVIGMASAQSGATLDDAHVTGTATIFEGSRITSAGYSRLHLNSGARLDLAAGSEAQVFANHAALQAGSSEIEASSGYEIDAQTLKIRLAEKNSIARVKVDGDKRVYVTALNAPVNVLNKEGLLVAKVTPGLPISFMAQGAAPAGFDTTGCVLNKGGAAIVTNDDGSQVSELRGADVRKLVGKRAHVVGNVDATATAGGGASQVVRVTRVTSASGASCSSVASKLGATTAAAGLGAAAGAGAATGAAAGAAAGVTVGTTAAVVAGVAAATAATVGGLAAAGSFSTPSP